MGEPAQVSEQSAYYLPMTVVVAPMATTTRAIIVSVTTAAAAGAVTAASVGHGAIDERSFRCWCRAETTR